jgi:hypothetical protein
MNKLTGLSRVEQYRDEIDNLSTSLERSNAAKRSLAKERENRQGWSGRMVEALEAAGVGAVVGTAQATLVDPDGRLLGLLPPALLPLAAAAVGVPLAVVSGSDAVATAVDATIAATTSSLAERAREASRGIARIDILRIAEVLANLDDERRKSALDLLSEAGIRHPALGNAK